LAGEGIEYSWGCSKNVYQSMRLHENGGKENFCKSVDKCLDREILSTERIRKLSQRARQYICTYYKIAIEQEQWEETNTTDLDSTPIKVEKMVKLFKMHCCAMDFDSTFCKPAFIKTKILGII
jgi:hypothetical protein